MSELKHWPHSPFLLPANEQVMAHVLGPAFDKGAQDEVPGLDFDFSNLAVVSTWEGTRR